MEQLISSATTSKNSAQIDASSGQVSTYVFSVVDEGSFAGTVKVAARLHGRGRGGATTYPSYLAITNRQTGAIVDGATGVTAAGIYSVDLSGCEAQIQVTRSAGTYSVYGVPLQG